VFAVSLYILFQHQLDIVKVGFINNGFKVFGQFHAAKGQCSNNLFVLEH